MMRVKERLYFIKKKMWSRIYNIILDIRSKKIRKRNFTIICNNCMGGFIYHRLHMQFTSPTINLWIGDNVKDYISFLKNIREYMEKELVFIHDGIDKYPRAWLGDVKIGFSHYSNEYEAKQSWDRRKKRIFWDSLYVIVYARAGISMSDYEELNKCGFRNVAIVGNEYARGGKGNYAWFKA